MYADDKPKGPEWKSAEEETNALRIDRLERKVNQASADISSLAPMVKTLESSLGDYRERTRNQRETIRSLCERVNGLEQKAPPVHFVEGAKDKIEALGERVDFIDRRLVGFTTSIKELDDRTRDTPRNVEARGDAMVDVMEGVLAAEERGEKVDSALDLLARRVASLEEAAVPLDTAVRLTNLESEMAQLRPHRDEFTCDISSTQPDAGDDDWILPPADVLIERQPPFTLFYLQGHRKPIATTFDMTHARGLAHAYAPSVGVAIHCRDANGRMIFEVEPGDKEGA